MGNFIEGTEKVKQDEKEEGRMHHDNLRDKIIGGAKYGQPKARNASASQSLVGMNGNGRKKELPKSVQGCKSGISSMYLQTQSSMNANEFRYSSESRAGTVQKGGGVVISIFLPWWASLLVSWGSRELPLQMLHCISFDHRPSYGRQEAILTHSPFEPSTATGTSSTRTLPEA